MRTPSLGPRALFRLLREPCSACSGPHGVGFRGFSFHVFAVLASWRGKTAPVSVFGRFRTIFGQAFRPKARRFRVFGPVFGHVFGHRFGRFHLVSGLKACPVFARLPCFRTVFGPVFGRSKAQTARFPVFGRGFRTCFGPVLATLPLFQAYRPREKTRFRTFSHLFSDIFGLKSADRRGRNELN